MATSTQNTSESNKRALLRNALQTALPMDSDFDAFCMDYFPDVYRRLSGTMDRVQKMNVLLWIADIGDIAAKLSSLSNNTIYNLIMQTKMEIPSLHFRTQRLDNDDFIFSATPWPFQCDPRGEDISSKHSSQSTRKGIRSFRPFNSDHPTIASNELTIDFSLANTGSLPIYIEAIGIDIHSKFMLSEKMFSNTWMPIIEPYTFKILINNLEMCYQAELNDAYFEVQPKSGEHYRLIIMSDQDRQCQKIVIEFSVWVECHDLEGVHSQIKSDRLYHLGFT